MTTARRDIVAGWGVRAPVPERVTFPEAAPHLNIVGAASSDPKGPRRVAGGASPRKASRVSAEPRRGAGADSQDSDAPSGLQIDGAPDRGLTPPATLPRPFGPTRHSPARLAWILILAAALAGCGDEPEPIVRENAESLAGMELTESPPWKRLKSVWGILDAMPNADYLSDDDLRELRETIASGRAEVELLERAGMLLGTEAELLILDLYPPTGMIGTPRYSRGPGGLSYDYPLDPSDIGRYPSTLRLKEQLPLLEWLLDEKHVRPAVMARIVPRMKNDIRAIRKAANDYGNNEKFDAKGFVKQAEQCLGKVEAALATPASAPSR